MFIVGAEYGYVVVVFDSGVAEEALWYAYRWLRGRHVGVPVVGETAYSWDTLPDPEYIVFAPGFTGLGYRSPPDAEAGGVDVDERLTATILGGLPLRVERGSDGEHALLAGTTMHPHAFRITPGFTELYPLVHELLTRYNAHLALWGVGIDLTAIDEYLRQHGYDLLAHIIG